MPTQLTLYNGALLILGERSLASLAESRESRRLLDTVWVRPAIRDVLEMRLWNFATRRVEVEYSPSVSPAFGYSYAFDRPSDIVRTVAFCSDEEFRIPNIQYMWQNGLASVLTDQAFAASIRRFSATHDPRGGALHFLGGGGALWIMWQLTNVTGYLVGNVIPAAWSLEFAVPLCFIALVAPALRDVPAIVAAATAGVFVLALAGLPMKLNLIVAGVIGIVVGTLADLARERWKARCSKLWLVILAVGALNYLSRLSFIAVFGRRSMPAWLARPLKFVPAAMLTALILPMIVGAPAVADASWAQPKVAAALVAAVVAYFTRSTLKTLAVGMLALWGLQWLARSVG